MTRSNDHLITSLEALEAHYGAAVPLSLTKELDHISDHYRAFIEAAPFVAIASSGQGGLDCSPRGDPAGFVRVTSPRTIMLPDQRGNNRLDTLKNIVGDPRVALLFLIPGVGETMRINGQAVISTDPGLCAGFIMQGKTPASVIVVTVDSVYFQCQKALARSRLWDPDARVDRATLPTAGEMAEALSAEPFDGAAYDAAYPERMKTTIY
ncbi:MAG: pyridoxamine 5'-phosphate oxidase family protein [Alphaproteobacteria bacterium]|nr:pyridoxamine 5'-phosphate oxidase family protein [Alphaproteobacteria bacterium]